MKEVHVHVEEDLRIQAAKDLLRLMGSGGRSRVKERSLPAEPRVPMDGARARTRSRAFVSLGYRLTNVASYSYFHPMASASLH